MVQKISLASSLRKKFRTIRMVEITPITIYRLSLVPYLALRWARKGLRLSRPEAESDSFAPSVQETMLETSVSMVTTITI